MQIGVSGDPGLNSLLSAEEGGDLILPPQWRGRLTIATVRSSPVHNIRAGIGYLLMRMANFEHRTVFDPDARIHSVTVKPMDTLGRIARSYGSTVDALIELNPTANMLRPGQVLRVQKASIKKMIVSWRTINAASVARRYNGGGDPNYERKLDFALALIHAAERQPE